MRDATRKKAGIIDWLPALCVSFAAFIFTTSTTLPVGLLPEIAHSLQ
jgi:predicted MFS family arabinose efflux permease